MLDRFLKWLSGRLRPRLVRGDVGFGNEVVILCCERNATRCLFKLRRTKRVKELFRLHLASPALWQDAGKGHAGRVFAQISGALEMVSAASQLKVEERWQLLVYYAFRKYQLVHGMYPPPVDGQILLPLA